MMCASIDPDAATFAAVAKLKPKDGNDCLVLFDTGGLLFEDGLTRICRRETAVTRLRAGRKE